MQGISLAQACEMTLSQLTTWVDNVPASLPPEMLPMAESICESFQTASKRLMELGLGYLSLDRAASTLSTGERQRMQLARAVRNRTTGVLYVLDEPSIGLHPVNIVGLTGVMDDLIADGNSVILVDHDTQILSHADWLIEMGPEAGAKGGQVIAEGTIADIAKNKDSRIGAFLKPECTKRLRPVIMEDCLFEHGAVSLATGAIHTVKPLEVKIPKGRLTVVTGVSGSGKTTLILESLVPGMEAAIAKAPLPSHVLSVDPAGISQVKLIDATPIGINVRSTALLMPMSTMNCEKFLPKQQMPKIWDIKQVIFPIIRENFAALYVTAPVRSVWMYSFCLMLTFHARSAEVPDMPKKLPSLNIPIKRGKKFPFRNLWTWTSTQLLKPAMT